MNRMPSFILICLSALLLFVFDVSAAPTLTYQGQLNGQNGAVNASYPMTFALYESDGTQNALWQEAHSDVAVLDGVFTVILGSETALDGVAQAQNLYLGITVGDGAEMTPRMKVGSAIRAQWAAHAQDVLDEDIHPRTVSIGDTVVIDENGDWVGDLDGMQGERGDTGERGDQGPQGPRGEAGPRGDSGPRGDTGPVGPRGRDLNFATDSDQDGWYDWVESAAGTSPNDDTDMPVDTNGDYIADVLAGPQGPQGLQGPAGESGAQGPAGDNGGPGAAGANAAEIESVLVDETGLLTVFMTDFTTRTASGRVAGPQGAAGPQGPRGRSLSFYDDTDSDGWYDWLEIAVGANPNDLTDMPLDTNGDNIPDELVGTAGPRGLAGPAGATGPVGPAGELDLALDSDNDGYADWIEVSVGTNLNSDQSVPADIDNNNIADGVQGVQGPVGPAGPAGLAGTAGPAGEPGATGPEGPAGAAGPQGIPGDIGAPQFEGRYGLNLGSVVPGDTVASAQQALVIADDNVFGVTGVIVAPQPGATIERLSVDVNIEHPDVSQLTVTLISPSGTEIVLHNPTAGAGADLITNYPRQSAAAVGSMEDCFDETTPGVWSLKIIDDTEGPFDENGAAIEGRLVSWSVNFNEAWSGSDIFTGNDMIVDGKIITRSGIEVNMNGNILLSNADNSRQLSINAQDGIRLVGSTARIPLIVTLPEGQIEAEPNLIFSNESRMFDGENDSYGYIRYRAPDTSEFEKCVEYNLDSRYYLNRITLVSLTYISNTSYYVRSANQVYIRSDDQWESVLSQSSGSWQTQQAFPRKYVDGLRVCLNSRCQNSSQCSSYYAEFRIDNLELQFAF